jgi:hypothetical protein
MVCFSPGEEFEAVEAAHSLRTGPEKELAGNILGD